MRIFKWTAALYIMWLGFTMSLDPQELIVGGALSLLVAWFGTSYFEPRFGRILPLMALKYIGVLLITLIKSNIDVAHRILNPKLPINPGVVKIKTALDSPFKRLILANSITLTPGTVTIDMQNDLLYIHWIDVESKDPEKAGELIKGDFEAVLSK